MTIDQLKKYQRILILGYGLEGKATHLFLKKIHPDAIISIADKKTGSDYLGDQKNYDLVIKTPGIRGELVTVAYTTATNIFFANFKGKTIGVTGSKGKSTTASLIYQILKRAGLKVHLAGNIGSPMLKLLLGSNQSDDIFVLELSSFQLSDIEYSPNISVILNLLQDHMDYHGNLHKYWTDKTRIIKKAKKDDYFIYNSHFPQLIKLASETAAMAIPITTQIPGGRDHLPLLGEHNVENIEAATTVARLLNISDSIISEAIADFKPLPHRLQFIGEYRGIKFYDDAISTTPDSVIAAIQSLKPIGSIIMGGEDRGYDFSHLAKKIKESQIPICILFPDSGKNILHSLKKAPGPEPQIFETNKMEAAVKYAYENTPSGTICILSNGSPSFSLWRNFEEKGKEFQKWVLKYGKKSKT